MNRTRVLQEIRKMRFKELYQRQTQGKLTIVEAAEVLGIHERTFRRWSQKYEEEGASGLADKRLDKIAHNAASVDEVITVITLFETRYSNFNVSHFYEKWQTEHGGTRGYTWVKKCLQEAGLVAKAKSKGKHRRKRPRKPMPGMMLHQDGSNHEWVPNQRWDLIVTLDDATNEIYSAFFVIEEGMWSSFQGVKEVIIKHGLFCSLYTDRGSHYWTTPKAGEKVDKHHLTQFGRAMQQLGIDMIPAYSPEARGRSERAFRTLQDRLPKELALANITDMISANQFLKDIFIPKYNQRFTVNPEELGSAFIPWLPGRTELNEILCLQEKRTVNKDNTVSYQNKKLQIPKDSYRYHYVKTQVNVHEYNDGRLSLFHGPRHLASYDQNGELINKETPLSHKQVA
jgi:transposase